MSKLRLSELANLADSSRVGIDYVLQGTAKLWGTVSQVGVQSVFDSFNVSSIADLGTGQTQFNAAVALPNANYSIVGGVYTSALTDGLLSGRGLTVATASVFAVGCFSVTSTSYQDVARFSVVIDGDPT